MEFRKRVSWYARNLDPCTRLRQEMRLVNDADDFEGILSRFLEWRRERDAQRPHTSTIDEPVPAMAGE